MRQLEERDASGLKVHTSVETSAWLPFQFREIYLTIPDGSESDRETTGRLNRVFP